MRTVIVNNLTTITLGVQGENGATLVRWLGIVPQYKAAFGDGTFALIVMRPKDISTYPAVVNIEGNDLVWVVSDADTAQEGSGKCELTYIVDDVVAKSRTWATRVYRSISGDAPGDPPEPYQSWVDKVMQETADLKIQGVPKGGAAGQFLSKKSDEDFDTEWMDVKAGVESVNGQTGAAELDAEDVGALPDTTEIPKPDWNEDDENSANYVKNRTHYAYINEVAVPDFEQISENYYKAVIPEAPPFLPGEKLTIRKNGEYINDTVKLYSLDYVTNWAYIGDEPAPYSLEPSFGEYGWTYARPIYGTPGEAYFASKTNTGYQIPQYTNFHPLNKHYLPSSAVLLDSDTSTLKSPIGDDITDNVKQIVKDGASITLAHITQSDIDSDGNPVWGLDKTYDELKAAYDKGNLLGVEPSYGSPLWVAMLRLSAMSYIPLVTLNGETFVFGFQGFDTLYPVDLGALAVAQYIIRIKKNTDGETVVNVIGALPDMKEYIPNPNAINIPIPQQYCIRLVKAEDGTITSQTPFDEITRCIVLYTEMSAGIFKDDKFGFADMFVVFADDTSTMFKFSGSDNTSDAKIIFTATTSRGLETVTVSNDGTNDVWTHEVKPFTFFVHITSERVNGKTVYKADKTYNEIVAAVQSGLLTYCNYPADSIYGPHDRVCAYSGIFTAPHGEDFIVFTSLWGHEEEGGKGCTQVIIKNSGISVRDNDMVMVGATEEAGGVRGYAPAPFASDQTKFLRGDATWAEIAELPPVSASDNGKILQVVNGEWAVVELTNANGSNF